MYLGKTYREWSVIVSGFIRTLNCEVKGCKSNSTAHHMEHCITDGFGLILPQSRNTISAFMQIPLCAKHHTIIEQPNGNEEIFGNYPAGYMQARASYYMCKFWMWYLASEIGEK